MTIWFLTVLLLASLAALGLRQGAIRVVCSFLGIVIGGLLAAPLGGLVKPLLAAAGVKNPLLLWFIPPCIIFLIILTLFKAAGLALHKKAEVYYKYKAGDLRLALWGRLNHRVGLCLGLLNGTAYMVVVSFVIYLLSYWTVQMATADSDPKSLRIVNRLGKDLESTRLSRVASAVDQSSPAYYDAADVVGLIYRNPSVQSRLSRYPGLIGLAQRPEFESLANDTNFTALRQTQASVAELLKYPAVQTIVKNPDLVKALHDSLVPNLKDLRQFLETGTSTNFTEKILGRWNFDANGAMSLWVRSKPTATATEKGQRRRWLMVTFNRATLIASPEQQAYLKNIPPSAVGAPPSGEFVTIPGTWKGSDGKYELALTLSGRNFTVTAEIVGDRMNIGAPLELAFLHEQ